MSSSQAIVLTGVRRCGKSTLQSQLMRRTPKAFYCNFEDTRLFGMQPDDFPTFLSVLDELIDPEYPVFLDEVQEIGQWQRLVRTLLDRGRTVCVTGSNASFLGRELGTKLTGRHLSYEVFPFSNVLDLCYAGARDLWECDFITPDAAIQVCVELTPANLGREVRGVVEGTRLQGRRRALVVTLDQADHLQEDGVDIEVIPAWRWM